MKSTKRIFTIFGSVIVLSLLVIADVWAFGVGNVDGVWSTIDTNGASCDNWASMTGASFPWSQTTPSIQSSGGYLTDENQVRYGRPGPNYNDCPTDRTGFLRQSGFGFDGVNTATLDANDRFYLGKFTHYNNPVSSTNSFLYVPLTVTVPITCEDNTVKNFTFTSTFTLDETSNSAPCTYPGTSVCPDKVTVTQPSTQTFSCSPGEDYTVNILGFTQGTGCDQTYSGVTTNEFITEESTNNVACLWAEIDRPNADASVSKSCTNFGTADPYYTITVTNAGPGTALGAKIVDTLPSGVDFISYTSTRTADGVSSSQGTCTNVSDTITCNLNASLPDPTKDPSAKWEVKIYVDYATGMEWTNSVTLTTTSTDPNPGNNTATANCSSLVDVSVDKADGDYTLSPYPSTQNPYFEYTVTVANTGIDAAQNVRMVDTLDYYTSFDTGHDITVDGIPVDASVCSPVSGTVTCNLGTMASGTSKEIKFWVKIELGVSTAGTLEIGTACSAEGKVADVCNTVNVYTDSNDINPSNNIAYEPKDVGVPTAVSLLYFEGTGAKNSVILNWATASELETIGFNLYRRSVLDGTMRPINQLLVQAESVGLVEGSTYTFRVEGLKAGKYYYFWLEDVDVYGNTTLHGPIYVKAKRKNP